jgi:transposase-like protein
MQEESITRQRVRIMLDAGMSVRDIARALDLSTQRVYQQKRKIETLRAKEREAS